MNDKISLLVATRDRSDELRRLLESQRRHLATLAHSFGDKQFVRDVTAYLTEILQEPFYSTAGRNH